MKNLNTQKKSIEYEKVADIYLDHTNARLPKEFQKGGEKTILNWMLVNSSLLELMTSIAENGYFEGEPILVVPHDKLEGKYTVIEGNRRLSAVKILKNPETVDKKENSIAEIIKNAKNPAPTKLPVLKFNHESEILDYLGYRHITGIKQWSPLAKAKYLDKLYRARKAIKDTEEKYRVIANIIGSKGYYTKRMHTTYRIFEKAEAKNFYNIPGLTEETIEFSNLNDALTKFKNISAFVKLDFKQDDPISSIDENRLKKVFQWMFYKHPETYETRLGEVRNLAKLNVILNPANEYAYNAFVKKGESIEKAFTLTDEPNKLFTKSLKEAFEGLQIAQQLFYSIRKPTKEDVEMLKKISEFSYDFHSIVVKKVKPLNRD